MTQDFQAPRAKKPDKTVKSNMAVMQCTIDQTPVTVVRRCWLLLFQLSLPLPTLCAFRTEWDVAKVAKEVAHAKEESYKQLTSDGISAFAGIVPLIEKAKKAGVPIGVGSSGAPEKIQHNLKSANLEHLVPPEHIVSAHQVWFAMPPDLKTTMSNPSPPGDNHPSFNARVLRLLATASLCFIVVEGCCTFMHHWCAMPASLIMPDDGFHGPLLLLWKHLKTQASEPPTTCLHSCRYQSAPQLSAKSGGGGKMK